MFQRKVSAKYLKVLLCILLKLKALFSSFFFMSLLTIISENESLDIERFSDSLKPKSNSNKKESFYDFLVLRPDNFPKELLGGLDYIHHLNTYMDSSSSQCNG